MYVETHVTTTQNKIQNVSSTLESSLMLICNQFLLPLPRSNHYSDFYHYRFILPVLIESGFQQKVT